ncbi:YpiF family protein [Bacillus cihuensis]|uniref:YpiF family protein n=1 Tax=Bacillus cihuensis TaxID=1208599 RepID=UPI00041F6F3B|nr:YpiF family protein [Bacillus cihuensis]
MKWTFKETGMYEESKEYVDSLIIPVNPITFGAQMKQFSSMHEFMTILTMEVEKQLKGRLLLMPALTYWSEGQEKAGLIDIWKVKLAEAEFKHIFWITSDSEWKRYEDKLPGTLLWIPAIGLEYLEEGQARQMMNDQVRQIIDMLTQSWNK